MSSKGSNSYSSRSIRATEEEKQFQIQTLENLHQAKAKEVENQISIIQEAAIQNHNIF